MLPHRFKVGRERTSKAVMWTTGQAGGDIIKLRDGVKQRLIIFVFVGFFLVPVQAFTTLLQSQPTYQHGHVLVCHVILFIVQSAELSVR